MPGDPPQLNQIDPIPTVSEAVQLARLRGVPSFVLFATRDVGCWVVGPRAAFHTADVHAGSDWDLLVPWPLWDLVRAAIPPEMGHATQRGGWRFTPPGCPTINVFPGDVGAWLTQPAVHGAWHPKTATVIVKVPTLLDLDRPGVSGDSTG